MHAHRGLHYRVRGFTLVEIMIVVAIIAMLAALAYPNFLRVKLHGNETVAVESLRTLSTALETYHGAQTPPDYPDGLEDLSDSVPPYVDSIVTSGTRQGYDFTYARIDESQFTVNADPGNPGVTGVRGFYVDETGVIRGSDSGAADGSSPPLQ